MSTRKKIIIFIITIFIITCTLIYIFSKVNLNNQENYKIVLEKIDEYSPDRKLEVLKNNEVIEFEKIYYDLETKEEIILCNGENPYVSYLDFDKLTKLVIVLKNGKKIHIEYIMEEEK